MMKPLSSLRSRLLLGAVLWAIGFSAFSLLVVTAIILHYDRRFPVVLHSSAEHHAYTYMIITVVCMVIGLVSVRRGLAPLKVLRANLGAVHKGEEPRVQGVYPSEVQPLVEDLNSLLDHREQMVRRALAKAGDLAHGLKTPLAVLSQEADRAAADGQMEIAGTIGQQVDRMRRQIEYHLAHARAAASGAAPGARCPVSVSVDGLSRTLQRLYDGRGIAIEVTVAPEHAIRGQREDLDEMLGNLLDNACKWARSRVQVASCERADQVLITVDDDGPGLAPEMWDVVLQRGVRADEAAPGSGLGLAIVRELAELYGGSIALNRSPIGGLRAELRLPGGTRI
jgi:signal transduction histidine kinase